jgi:hypothetical protein
MALFNLLNMMTYSKMTNMETMFTMVNCYSRGYYEIKSEMPQIAMFDSQTLNHIVNLSDMILNAHDKMYQRALMYGSVILGIYSIEFGYIYVELIIRKLSPNEIPGGKVFIVYSFFNFFANLMLVLQIIYFGAYVNQIDGKIRKELNDNKTSALEVKARCELG